MYEHVICCGAGKFVSQGEWIHPDRIIHSHELIFVLRGNVYITENDRSYVLQKNDLLFLESGLRHYGYQASSDTSFYWVHFTGAPAPPAHLKLQSITDSYNLSFLFKQLMHYRAEKRSDESLDYLTRLILLECFNSHEIASSHRICEEVAAWIRANCALPMKVEQIAEHFGYHPDYLRRIFKASYGKSIKTYLDDMKMKFIKTQLLTSDLALSQIADRSGFSDYKYFLKFFKYHEGVTPTQFMKAYPKTHINRR